MADQLVLYTHPWSRGRVARWMLEETGQPYTAEILDYGTTMKAPAYLAVNPMGKVPALRHGDVVVTELAAICSYLADAFPEAGLAPPPGSRERGAYYRWLFFGAGCVEPATTAKALGLDIPEDKRRMLGYGSLEQVAEVLDRHLSGREFIAGDRFTAADLYVGAQLGWTMQFDLMPRTPTFEAYVGRLMQRPASVRANAIDDKLAADLKAASGG